MKVDNQLFSDNMDVWSLMDGYHWKQDKQGGAKHVEEFNMFEFKPMLILGGANHRHLIATSHRSLELSVLRKVLRKRWHLKFQLAILVIPRKMTNM